MKKRSWENVSGWYDSLVGGGGHYYHQEVILPEVLKHLSKKGSLLDVACGQGVLARALPKAVEYVGIDLSPSLIKAAQKKKFPSQTFLVADATEPYPIEKKDFDMATIILALQDIEDAAAALKQTAAHLRPKGKLVIVLNHPCFRIPRQSHWGVDEKRRLQYRRLDLYLSPLAVPIQTQPGKGKKSETTLSHHRPISLYTQWLKQAGFLISEIEEWCSNKKSTGPKAKMENRARGEFPLFMAIVAVKDS